MAVGDDDDGGAELDLFGLGGEPSHVGEGLVVGGGIGGYDLGGEGDVVGGHEEMEAHGLGVAGPAEHEIGGGSGA